MASTELTMPVFMRVGGQEEFHLGDITFDLASGEHAMPYTRADLASFLRAAADEIENPSEDAEEPT